MSDRPAIRDYYDRIGRGQDTQRFYEDPATDRLRQRGQFETAASVVELGCGTGRFARMLLRSQLPAAGSYSGFELSGRMADIAASRLRPWGGRACVTRIEGDPPLPLDDARADRFIANYVLDLMGRGETRQWLQEAHRILAPAGLLCLVSITHAKARWATLRTHLIAVPARIATSARRLVLHLPTNWPWAPAWEDLWATATTP